jgi:hypothetical protein
VEEEKGLRIQLIFTDPGSDMPKRPILETPIALGSEFMVMPSLLSDRRVSRLTIKDPQISSYHALIDDFDGQVMVIDQQAPAGVKVNGVMEQAAALKDGDRLQLGGCEILVRLVIAAETAPARSLAQPVPSAATPVSAESTSASGSRVSATVIPGDGCDRRVGFLFPRRCGRLTTKGCPHCQDGQMQEEPYFYYPEHAYYTNYGSYGGWDGGYGSTTGIDFTDADAASLATSDVDFEQDMGAS